MRLISDGNSVRIPMRAAAILIEVFRGFAQSLAVNVEYFEVGHGRFLFLLSRRSYMNMFRFDAKQPLEMLERHKVTCRIANHSFVSLFMMPVGAV
jgi:hypothetical protein